MIIVINTFLWYNINLVEVWDMKKLIKKYRKNLIIVFVLGFILYFLYFI